jgi:lactate dehydrogenase-like 2-hydroxyacid dehydrogenase
VRTGQWTSPTVPILGLDIHHRTLGIVGLGGVGRQIARRASGFDMTVLYTQRHRADLSVEQAANARHVPLDELLTQSDFVVLQVPATPQTHHMIGARELSLMKKSAVLINTARGGVVDDAALAAALEAGTIAGAGLDVFENEPAILPALLKAPGLTLMPHLGSATLATRHAMVTQAVDNLIAGLEGRTPPNRVNPPA